MKKIYSLPVSFIILLLMAVSMHASAVIYVTPFGAGNHSGTSWDNAATLEEASGFTGNTQEIWLAAGVHSGSDTIRLRQSVYGGFAGTETQRDQRDPAANVSAIAFFPSVNVSAAAHQLLDGFTVGNTVVDSTGSLFFNNVIFSNGVVKVVSTALNNAPATFTDCIFKNMPSTGTATAILQGASSFTRCVFQDNNMANDGALHASPGITLEVDECTFKNNSNTIGLGSAMYLDNVSAATVVNCLFTGNGGSGNSAYIKEGAAASISFFENTFAGNTNSNVLLIQNSSVITVNFMNNIVWGNTGVTDWLDVLNSSGQTLKGAFSYNLLQAAITEPTVFASHNVVSDPLFNADYSLQACSPAINQARQSINENSSNVADATGNRTVDMAGNARIVGGNPDMGCFEYQGSNPPEPVGVNVTPASAEVCAGANVTLSGTGNDGETYIWSGGITDGVAFVPASTTTYTVTVTKNGCARTATQKITVDPTPTVIAHAFPSQYVCFGSSVTLFGGGGNTNYTWTPTVTDNVQFVPLITNTFTVSSTNSFGCSASDTITVKVTQYPDVQITGAPAPGTGVCPGTPVTLHATGADTYVWQGGQTGDSATYYPQETDNYVVTGTVNGCSNTSPSVSIGVLFTTPIGITSSPASATVCAGSSVTLTGISSDGEYVYSWSGGITNGVPFVPGAAATYTLTGTELVNQCTRTATITVHVNQLPAVGSTASPSGTVCVGSSVTLNGTGASTYIWTGGVTDGVAFAVPANPTYTVTGTDGNGCHNASTITVPVYAPTVVTADNVNRCVDGLSVTLSGSPAGGTFSLPNPYSGPATTYTYSYTDGNGCPFTSAPATVSVYSLPTVTGTASPSTNVCVGSSLWLIGHGASTYTWTGGVTDNTRFDPTADGTYTVTGTDAHGCSNTSTVSITMKPLPTVDINVIGDTDICPGTSVKFLFTASPGIVDYQFSEGVQYNVPFVPEFSDTYFLDVVDGFGCAAEALQVIIVKDAPYFDITASPSGEVCEGTGVTLTANATDAVTFSWDNGITDGVAFVPTQSGVYTVTATHADGCTAVGTQAITVDYPATWYLDADGDGYYSDTLTSCGSPGAKYSMDPGNGPDCDDFDATKWISEDFYIDRDGDGYDAGLVPVCYGLDLSPIYSFGTAGPDCDDNNPNVHEGSTWYLDADNDGHYVSSTYRCSNPGSGYNQTATQQGDCNDNDNTVWQTDSFYIDADGDGYDAGTEPVCYGNVIPSGYSDFTFGSDCDDNNPGIQEASTWYLDADNDDHYVSSTSSCDKPAAGYNQTASQQGDCDDNDNTKWQSASLYIDADGDGYDGGTEPVCYGDVIPAGHADFTFGSDCDDANSAVNPGAFEICNGLDDDCNGKVDDNAADASLWYKDADGDTYGDATDEGTLFCTPPPSGYSIDNTDCDDQHATVHPGATEVCDGLDDDCNGVVDDFPIDGSFWYADKDKDSYGDANGIPVIACVAPPDYVADNTDCDDTNASINPAAVETCNGVDDNCNGLTDDEDTGVVGQSLWYVDADQDGYGDINDLGTFSCNQIPGSAPQAIDCDDNNAAVNPGATEVCNNNIDDNCDGQIDEGCGICAFPPAVICPNDIVVSSACDAVKYGISATSACSMIVDSFIYTGVVQTWVVPAGVTSIIAEVRGAQGAGPNPGKGGSMKGVLPVTSGETLYILVGGSGLSHEGVYGYNGGGQAAYAGGGASDIRTGSGTLNDRIIVAGGGGGAVDFDNCPGGNGGGLTGDSSFCGAQGGTQTAAGGDGDFGFGGLGHGGSHGGGGGGGWYGGDGGGLLSGGGGSGYLLPSATLTFAQNGVQSGDGLVIISTFTGTINQIAGLPSSSVFPQGTTINMFVATDNSGNKDTCSFNVINNNVPPVWYLDNDGDGYFSDVKGACFSPGGHWTLSTLGNDCNDNDAAVHSQSAWFYDGDGDGYYGQLQISCSSPDASGKWSHSTSGPDCDDNNAAASVNRTWYLDADNDGYFTGTPQVSCDPPAGGYVVSAPNGSGDCDDGNPFVNPGATEICNGIDDNCNGTIDEGCITYTYYADTDGDTYGNPNDSVISTDAVPPAGYVTDNTDCDDHNKDVFQTTVFYIDADGDGYDAGTEPVCYGNVIPSGYSDFTFGSDCDDNNPGIQEASTWYLDADNDGHYVSSTSSCDKPAAGYNQTASQQGDCDDNDNTKWQSASLYIDADGDGYDGGTEPVCYGDVIPAGHADFTFGSDCDDANSAVNPGAFEICNGLDDDCNGKVDDNAADASIWYKDVDGDTYGDDTDEGTLFCTPPATGYSIDNTDCDDQHATVHPGATEVCDGLDDDCNGVVDDFPVDGSFWYADNDHDTYGDANGIPVIACAAPPDYVADNSDCDDTNAAINPAAVETCNGVDDNCNGLTDDEDTGVVGQSLWYVDVDQDGYGDINDLGTFSCNQIPGSAPQAIDCDDNNAAVNPGATEVCNNNIDDNCDGQIDEGCTTFTYYADADHDSYGNPNDSIVSADAVPPTGYVTNKTDCDDSNAAVHPNATEVCNGIDDDCNGLADNADPNTSAASKSLFYVDNDHDGYGAGTPILACSAAGYVTVNGDCNDANAVVHPGATEVCNGIDDDCNGLIDNADPGTSVASKSLFYIDNDHDGYGAGTSILACSAAGYVTVNGDCNDANAAVHPGATEVCNGIDDDCNGLIDNADPGTSAASKSLFYIDNDHDGYGIGTPVLACSAAGYATVSGDCNDANPAVHPGATEVCNGIDDDCNGLADDSDPSTSAASKSRFYVDNDHDSYGSAVTVLACSASAGYATVSGDCNDANPAIHPGAPELCNGIDDNCNGQIDEGVKLTFYRDADNDGYGNPSSTPLQACSPPLGYVANNTDCNDSKSAIHPGAPELCNGIDDNCNGQIDEGVKLTFYRDADNDGYGNPSSTPLQACSPPSGYVANNKDCNDSKSAIHPGAPELCNGIDDNCNGQIDEGVTHTFYRDADRDGYGDPSVSVQACSEPSGYVTNNTDCNDHSAAIHPGAKEICNGIDDNCNGQTDEGVKLTFYRDADTDGYGNPSVSTQACAIPSGYVTNNTDCNDNNAAIHPGASEICGNNIDDDCNGRIDDGCSSGICANANHLATINITATGVIFTWSASVDPLQWNVEYKTVSNGSQWASILLPGSARSVHVTGLKVNQTYHWHIQAKCGKTWTDFTDAIAFKTSSSTSRLANETDENETGDFKLFPNPNNGNFEIQFVQPISKATIEIFNAVGQKVFMNAIIEEKTRLDISSGDLPQGIYLLRLTSKDGVEAKRFMIVK